ncbi:Serine/threonine protein phosphatase PrpC [Pedobacter steynii]|uniref:Serine/threonine protein phosphatase PrpC n=1 Tax=Pedobacter steynii TaxID=430522 RepID=A0A1G9LFU6_9SPHI|nr:hypothetical protein [Pedobacter steynii]NQX38836.1 hypothetical protein [Pedobacter steynii]SDL60822.1 Serine/threonine protein phosphatase PrpC [Pedobacter steynii]
MSPINAFRFSCSDPFDKENESENEDAIFYCGASPDFLKAAISDGAGGAGIFCGDWARHLVNNQPDKPFLSKDKAEEWFLGVSKNFYDSKVTQLDASDAFIVEKFHNDGSYATLVLIWWDTLRAELYYWGHGDSTLFLFEKNGDRSIPKLIFPIGEQSSLNDPPKLFNWNKKLDQRIQVEKKILKSDDQLILTTDSISRWLILQLMLLSPMEMPTLLGEQLYSSVSKEGELLESLNLRKEFNSTTALLEFIERGLQCPYIIIRKNLSDRIERAELEKDDLSILMLTK